MHSSAFSAVFDRGLLPSLSNSAAIGRFCGRMEWRLGDRSSAGGYVSHRGTNFGDRNSWAIFAAWKIVMRT
jgi:hypothetical protein